MSRRKEIDHGCNTVYIGGKYTFSDARRVCEATGLQYDTVFRLMHEGWSEGRIVATAQQAEARIAERLSDGRG